MLKRKLFWGIAACAVPACLAVQQISWSASEPDRIATVDEHTGRVTATQAELDPRAISQEAQRKGLDRIIVDTPVLSAEEQRRADLDRLAREGGDVRKLAEDTGRRAACDGEPTTTRAERVQVVGLCDDATGVPTSGRSISGPSAAAIPLGVRESLRLIFGRDLGNVKVDVDPSGLVVVDLPAEFDRALVDISPHVPRYAVTAALADTVYSDSRVQELRLQLDGNCMAYALATGGDTCTTIDMGTFNTGGA